MRNAFIDELSLAAEINDKIFLVVGDLGYGVVETFASRFPHRFLNAGVAEQNMMGLASGLASEGFNVFVYSIANFPTFRCAEQIRNDVDYQNLPVTIVATGGGLAYGNLGYSHHAVQDYSLMRVLPNMLVAAPGDPMEVRACVRYIVDAPQPSYLRLGKAGEPCIHAEVPLVSPGKWLPIREGNGESTYLTTGTTLEIVRNAVINNPSLESWGIFSLPLWGMKSKAVQPRQAERYSRITTVEDHLIDGGFGSWFMEALSAHPGFLAKVDVRHLDQSVCGMVGKQSVLHSCSGLSFPNG